MSADARRRRMAAKRNPYSKASGVYIPPPGPASVVTQLPLPAPSRTVDLDGISDRYTALCEARAVGDHERIRLAAEACADDVPLLRDRLVALIQELDSITWDGA